jgi:hypothetical protein
VRALALGVLLFAVAGGACADGPVDLGADPDFLWWSDHETGDLSDWLNATSTFGATYIQGGDLAVTTEQRRSGTHALRSVVSAPAAGEPLAAAQVWRSGFAVPAAYYGAWFFLPAAAEPTTYWVIFAFHTEQPTVALWDLKLSRGASGLELQLLHHDTGNVAPLAHVAVPLGRWFHVEAFYRPAPDASGRLQIWLDGQAIYDLSGAPTAPADGATAPVTWMVGSITDGLAPAPATLYLDDAYVSRRRLGPGFPPFWRGH